jgi:hypothetical protein
MIPMKRHSYGQSSKTIITVRSTKWGGYGDVEPSAQRPEKYPNFACFSNVVSQYATGFMSLSDDGQTPAFFSGIQSIVGN